jgi:hypothetical protein
MIDRESTMRSPEGETAEELITCNETGIDFEIAGDPIPVKSFHVREQD